MKKSFIFTSVLLTSFVALTSYAFAQTAAVNQATGAISSLSSIVDTFTETLVKSLGNLAMAAGMIAFFYGIVQYVWGVREAKPDVIKTGNQFMMYGLLALFVMFSVYGIIKFGQSIFFKDMGDITTIKIPEIRFIRGASSGSFSQPSSPAVSGSNPFGSGQILCPDGATYTTNRSDCPSWTCPNGNVYYNPSDRSSTCGGSSSGSLSVPEGGSCTTASQCSRQLICTGGVCKPYVSNAASVNQTQAQGRSSNR
jgi:hypothetical protein